MMVILAARWLLILPLFLPSPVEFVTDSSGGNSSQPADRIHPFYVFAIIAGALIGNVLPISPSNWQGLHWHPAVSTLGYDSLISVVSSLVWVYVAW